MRKSSARSSHPPRRDHASLYHEFHSLSLSVLDVSRSGSHTWTPEAPGIELTPIAEAPRPARSAPQRLVQMRALTHDFSASTKDDKERRWELRLLPQPLYRYKSTDPDVLDGALFAFVTSAGTDPEALLVLEARKPAADGRPGLAVRRRPVHGPEPLGTAQGQGSLYRPAISRTTCRSKIPSTATACSATGTYRPSKTRSHEAVEPH